MKKLNATNVGSSRTIAFRISDEDFAHVSQLARDKRMTVTSFLRSHLLDFLAKESVKEWANDQLSAITASAASGSSSAQSKDVLEAIFASYHMLYEIVNARDAKASQRAIELGQKDAERELRNSSQRRS